ncbi:MAG: BolA family protein [Henriciella sp.]|jgi:BolA protein
MKSRQQRIRDKLTKTFAPVTLSVTDESARHAGHAGARPEGETHFKVELTSDAFTGLTRVARQRAVMGALSQEFDCGLHALSIKAEIPSKG